MNYKFDGSKVFFTSDTHFYHGNIIRFCNRPFKDVEVMNETIISNWNITVGQDDIVFHLGDFCLGGSAEWTKILDRLNGKIYLIMGNHDLKNIRQGYIDRFEHVAMQMHIEICRIQIFQTLEHILISDTHQIFARNSSCCSSKTFCFTSINSSNDNFI